MPPYMVRVAQPTDAEGTLAHIQQLAIEPGTGVLIGPCDPLPSLHEERQTIADYAAVDNWIKLVADADGVIIGICTAKGGRRDASRGNVGVGLSVDAAWRGQGVGTALMERLIAWARETGFIWRIELDVFTHNTHAISLYQKLGFEIEGRRRKAYFKDGAFVDAFMMSLLLES